MREGSSGPSPQFLMWAAAALGAVGRPIRVVPLGQPTTGPWRLDADVGGAVRRAVLHVGQTASRNTRRRLATRAAALEVARRYGLSAPRIIAVDNSGTHAGAPALLTTLLSGSSAIPRLPDRTRLRALGAVAASIHAVGTRPSPALPHRRRPLEGASFPDRPDGASAELRRRARAGSARARQGTREPLGLVHGDLWHGNTMWDRGRHTGTIDWDYAGVGPAGIDLGSARCDAAIMFGPDAPDEILAGWEEESGAPATRVAYWDVVAGLSTPDDMAHWLGSFHAQARTDLSVQTATRRRDHHMARALEQLV